MARSPEDGLCVELVEGQVPHPSVESDLDAYEAELAVEASNPIERNVSAQPLPTLQPPPGVGEMPLEGGPVSVASPEHTAVNGLHKATNDMAKRPGKTRGPGTHKADTQDVEVASEGPMQIPAPDTTPETQTGDDSGGDGGHVGGVEAHAEWDDEREAAESRMLGYPIERLKTQAPGYSERRQLLEDARRKIETRARDYADAARTVGIELTEEEIANWQPTTDAELADIRKRLRPERVRGQMMDGLHELVHDESRMSKLFDDQKDAIVGVQRFVETATRNVSGDKTGYITQPTGTGKTRIMAEAACGVKRCEDEDDPITVGILTPTRPIQGQIVQTLESLTDKGVGQFNGDTKVLSESIDVFTNASFNQLVASGKMPHRDFIFVDETHTALGENIKESLRQYAAQTGCIIIGLTATEAYDDEKRVSKELTHKIHEFGLIEAIECGRLAAPAVAIDKELEVVIDESQLSEDPRERRREIQTACFDQELADAMPTIVKDVKAGLGVLVQCPAGGDIAYARRAAEEIRKAVITTNDRGYRGAVRALAVGGSTQSPKDMERLFRKFRDQDNSIHVITFVDAVKMGVDLPNADRIWRIGKDGLSAVEAAQVYGRVLRRREDDQGRVVDARGYTYRTQFSSAKRYTFRDVLGLQPGQTKSSIKATKQYERKHEPFDFREVSAVSRMAGETTTVVRLREKLQQSHRGMAGIWTAQEACERLGFDIKTVGKYLKDLGYVGLPSLPAYEFAALAEIIIEDRQQMLGNSE